MVVRGKWRERKGKERKGKEKERKIKAEAVCCMEFEKVTKRGTVPFCRLMCGGAAVE